MVKWDYKIVKVVKDTAIAEMLKSYGLRGWELTTNIDYGHILIFKRPIDPFPGLSNLLSDSKDKDTFVGDVKHIRTFSKMSE